MTFSKIPAFKTLTFLFKRQASRRCKRRTRELWILIPFLKWRIICKLSDFLPLFRVSKAGHKDSKVRVSVYAISSFFSKHLNKWMIQSHKRCVTITNWKANRSLILSSYQERLGLVGVALRTDGDGGKLCLVLGHNVRGDVGWVGEVLLQALISLDHQNQCQ